MFFYIIFHMVFICIFLYICLVATNLWMSSALWTQIYDYLQTIYRKIFRFLSGFKIFLMFWYNTLVNAWIKKKRRKVWLWTIFSCTGSNKALDIVTYAWCLGESLLLRAYIQMLSSCPYSSSQAVLSLCCYLKSQLN